MTFEPIYSNRAPESVGPYPHARRIGDLLFLSGIGPRKKGDKNIPGVTLDTSGKIREYDIGKQSHAVFQNVKYVLEDAGTTWENIVDVTVFLTNIEDDFSEFNKIYGQYFEDVKPCRTTVEVNKLPTPIAIELKVIATI